jgi:hypothetical protein
MQAFGRLAVLAMAGLLTACAHDPAIPKWDQSSGLNLAPIAARFHVPRCLVSVPMTQEEALRFVERWGIPHPERRDDWIAMVATTKPGDELREVSCLTKGPRGYAAGDVFLGLFRDGVMIAEMHFVIIN